MTWIRQLFCNHTWTELVKGEIVDKEDTYCGYYFLFICNKCLAKKKITNL